MTILKKQIEKLEKEVNQLEEHGESNCPECDNCIICNEVDSCQAKLTLLKQLDKQIEDVIDFICETEGWTNHHNPQPVITTNRLKLILKQKLGEIEL